MPILGQTDRASAPRRWMRLGTIRKGTRDENGYPIDLDYFRFVPKKGPEAEALQKIWNEVYGAEPTKIEIFLPFDDVESNWQTWKESYGTTGLKFRCNGKYHVQWLKEDLTYEIDYATARQKLCPYCSGELQRTKEDPGDVVVGYLTAILIPFFEHDYMGTVTVTTTSVNDVMSITGGLFAMEDEARASGASIRNIAFNLVRVKEEITQRFVDKEGTPHRTRVEKSMVHLMPDPLWVMQSKLASRQKAFAAIAGGDIADAPLETPYQLIDEAVIEGEFNELPPEPEQEQPPPQKIAETTQPGRDPLEPRRVAEILQEHVERRRGSKFEYKKADERGKAEWKINKTLEGVLGNAPDTHLFLQFVVKESSFDLMDDAEIETLRKYFLTQKVDGEWILDAGVAQEIRDIVAHQRDETGQKPLFEVDEDEYDEAEAEPEPPEPEAAPEAEESIFVAGWAKLSIPKKRKYAESLFGTAKERGLKPMSFTDETVDTFIATVEAMLKAQEDE